MQILDLTYGVSSPRRYYDAVVESDRRRLLQLLFEGYDTVKKVESIEAKASHIFTDDRKGMRRLLWKVVPLAREFCHLSLQAS